MLAARSFVGHSYEGRARLRPASTMAVTRSTPLAISSTAKSTSMMAFFVTRPISIRMPITTGIEMGMLKRSSPRIAPPMERGSEKQDRQRLQERCRTAAPARRRPS